MLLKIHNTKLGKYKGRMKYPPSPPPPSPPPHKNAVYFYSCMFSVSLSGFHLFMTVNADHGLSRFQTFTHF